MNQSKKSVSGLMLAVSAGLLGVIVPTSTQAVSFGITATEGNADSAKFGGIVQSVINIILFIAGAAAAIYMIYSGFQYVTAGGDDEKASTARKGLINAIIGMIIVGGVYLLFGASRNVANTIGDGTGTTAGVQQGEL